MLFDSLYVLVYNLFGSLLSALPTLPDFPDSFSTVFDIVIPNLSAGLSFILYFTYSDIVLSLITISLTLWAFEEVYNFIMWLIRKIPLLGIS